MGSRYGTSGSKVTLVETADASGVATATGAKVLGRVGQVAGASDQPTVVAMQIGAKVLGEVAAASQATVDEVAGASQPTTGDVEVVVGELPHLAATILNKIGDCRSTSPGCKDFANSFARTLAQEVLQEVKTCQAAFANAHSNRKLVMRTPPSDVPSPDASQTMSVFTLLLTRGYFTMTKADSFDNRASFQIQWNSDSEIKLKQLQLIT